MEDEYFGNINFLKGILIISVIMAHVVQPTPFCEIVFFIISSYCMPLFLAISGFLLKEKVFVKKSFSDLIVKYYFRLVLPWLIAWYFFFIYLYYDLILTHNLTFELFINSILFPVWHLWFVPSLFFSIISIWLMKRLKIPDYLIFIAILIITTFVAFLINSQLFESSQFIYKLIIEYRPEYYIFFFLGYFLRNNKINPKLLRHLRYTGLFILPVFLFRLYYYFNISKQFLSLDFFFLNLLIITFILLFGSNEEFIRVSCIKWIGVNSLPIYLYHFLIYLLSFSLISDYVNIYIWFILTLFLIALFIIILYILNRINFSTINLYLFGSFDSYNTIQNFNFESIDNWTFLKNID